MNSNSVFNLAKKAKFYIKVHFFRPSSPILIFRFLAIFKLACVSTHSQKWETVWILLHFVDETVASALHSRMYAKKRFAPFASSVCNPKQSPQTLLQLYLALGDYLLKTIFAHQAVADYDTSILRYMHPSIITPTQCAYNVIARACKVAIIYGNNTLNDVFIEGVDSSIRRSICNHWAVHAHADLMDNAFRRRRFS